MLEILKDDVWKGELRHKFRDAVSGQHTKHPDAVQKLITEMQTPLYDVICRTH